MTMALLLSKMVKKKEIRTPFYVGQRVKLSQIGRDSILVMPHHSPLGVISKPIAAYPDSIAVVRDGSKTPLAYHVSYWEPA